MFRGIAVLGVSFCVALACATTKAPSRPSASTASASASVSSAAERPEPPERSGPGELEYQRGLSALKSKAPDQARMHFEAAISLLEKDAAAPLELEPFQWHAIIDKIVWSQNGERVVVVDDDSTSVLSRRGRVLFRIESQQIAGLGLSPDGSMLFFAAEGDATTVFDVDRGSRVLESPAPYPASEVTAALSPKGAQLLLCAGSPRCGCAVIETKTAKEQRFVPCPSGEPDPVTEAAYSPDGAWLALARTSGIQVLSTKTFAPIEVAEVLRGSAIGFENSTILSFESGEGRHRYDFVRRATVQKVERPSSIEAGTQRIRSERSSDTDVAWNGRVGATLDGQRNIVAWHSADGKRMGKPWPGPFKDFVIAPDGRTLAAIRRPEDQGGGLDMLNLENGRQTQLSGPLVVTAVSLSPPSIALRTGDNRALVIRGTKLIVLDDSRSDGRFHLSERGTRLAESGEQVRTWKLGASGFTDAGSGSLCGPHSYVVRGVRGFVLRDLDDNSSTKFEELDSVRRAAISADGRLLAIGIFECGVDLFDTKSQKLIERLAGVAGERDAGEAEAAAACSAAVLSFSPNQKRLLSIQADGRSVIHALGSKRSRWIVPGAHLAGLATDSGAVLVDRDHVIEVWRMAGKQPAYRLSATYGVTQLASAGKWVAIGEGNGVDIMEVPQDLNASASVLRIYALRNLSALVLSDAWKIEFIGADAREAQSVAACRFGNVSYPFQLCAHRFSSSDMLSRVFGAG